MACKPGIIHEVGGPYFFFCLEMIIGIFCQLIKYFVQGDGIGAISQVSGQLI